MSDSPVQPEAAANDTGAGSRSPKPDPILEHNRSVLLEALREAGACRALISYSGYGDSGNANEVYVFDGEGQDIPAHADVTVAEPSATFVDGRWDRRQVEASMPLRDALSDFADRAVDLHHAGFENNEGGEGEVIFDCAANSVRIEHRDFYVESYSTETEL